jgi:hypothetical protein
MIGKFKLMSQTRSSMCMIIDFDCCEKKTSLLCLDHYTRGNDTLKKAKLVGPVRNAN